MIQEHSAERTLGQKLKDARRAQAEARALLGKAIKQADDANGYVGVRRAKLEVWNERVDELQARWDRENATKARIEELDPKDSEAQQPAVPAPGEEQGLPVDFWDCVWCQSKEHKSFECPQRPKNEELPTIQPPAPSTAVAVSDDDIPW